MEPLRDFVFTQHARDEMERRALDEAVVRQVLAAPGRDCARISHQQDYEVLEGWFMKITYDEKTDTLTLVLVEGARVTESDEAKPGVVLDYDTEGNLVSLEVLDASTRVSETRRIEYETV